MSAIFPILPKSQVSSLKSQVSTLSFRPDCPAIQSSLNMEPEFNERRHSESVVKSRNHLGKWEFLFVFCLFYFDDKQSSHCHCYTEAPEGARKTSGRIPGLDLYFENYCSIFVLWSVECLVCIECWYSYQPWAMSQMRYYEDEIICTYLGLESGGVHNVRTQVSACVHCVLSCTGHYI